MTKFEDNRSPYLTVVEQVSKPTAPATGNQVLYMKTDHKLYHEDDGGTEAEIGAGPAGELGYTAITTTFTTSSNTLVDVTSLDVTVTVGSRPIKITVMIPLSDSGTDGYRNLFSIYDVTGSAQVQQVLVNNTTGSNGAPVCMVARVAPAAGSRTYKVQMMVDPGGGTGRLYCSATAPAFIMVEEI